MSAADAVAGGNSPNTVDASGSNAQLAGRSAIAGSSGGVVAGPFAAGAGGAGGAGAGAGAGAGIGGGSATGGRGPTGRGVAGASGRPGAAVAGSGGAQPLAGNAGTSGVGSMVSAGRGAAGASGSAGAQCSMPTGAVTYTLAKAAMPSAAQQAAYDKISAAMDAAVSYYNCYTNITKRDMVSYDPNVATADGSTNGSIRFGAQSSINYITAMHEISHSVGVGGAQFGPLVVDGIFTGKNATAQLVEITGKADDKVHADKQHFWPYGLNYTTEVKSSDDLIAHCKMVVAIRKDLGM